MTLYRLILSLALPVLLARLLWRILRGCERWADLGQRLGGGAPLPGAIWLHGASVGEIASLGPLVQALLARDPAARVLVTANTVTGRARAQAWAELRLTARLAPLDARWILARFFARHRPRALIGVEAEFWPNRFAMAAARSIPLLLVAARLSETTARRASAWPRLARHLLAAITWAAPQDEGSAQRLKALGLPPGRIGPVLDLKAAALSAPIPAEPQGLPDFGPRHRVLLAASTHAGEEQMVLAAFARLRAQDPDWRLILAPRHPDRAASVARLIHAAGMGFARRSRAELPGAQAPVYLADTLGEMGFWYRRAGLTLVGGSLVAKGGHTPFEPAAHGSAILHGPHVGNFAAVYGGLDAGEAARPVAEAAALNGAAALAGAIDALARPDLQQAMAARARRLLTPQGPDPTEAVLAALERALARPDA